jgi:glycosyltransferase involved in cell wall biosynthesis
VDVVHCVDSYHLLHPAEPPLEFAPHPRVRRHELRSEFGRISPLLTYQTGRPLLKGRQLQEILGARSYDVLHFHNVSLLGPKILTLEPPASRPVKLYTAHEHWLICPTHVLWKFNRAPCDRPQCFLCTLLARRPPQLWRYTRLLEDASRYIDQFLSPSRFSAAMHACRGFPRPLRRLPYFTAASDDDWQCPAPRPHPDPYFLFVGRLERIKGLHTLIRLWKQVKGADLLVAGTGTQAAELRAMAAADPRIRFLGERPQRQLGALYYHAVACIVPSLTYETFGMVSIEAFARKTPVIARDLGALPEVVEESGGGFVYRTDQELLKAIEMLLASPGLRAELGERGYQAFRRNWTCEAHLKGYFEIIEETAVRKFGALPWGSAAEIHATKS